MQKQSRMFDDIARMMTGASSLVFDMKREMETAVARRIELALSKTALVTRDEFEAVKAMAAASRKENEELKKALAALKEKE
jgi:BMFP domain-containing protein YqiC